MRILVLGGNGFLGSHIVDELLLYGHEISVFDRIASKNARIEANIRYYIGDFSDSVLMSEALENVDEDNADEVTEKAKTDVMILLRQTVRPEFLNRVNKVGEIIRTTMEGWKEKYKLIGDVRGIGAMRLVEFVKDRDSKEPDAEATLEIIRDAVAHGLIMIRAGLFSNCIRLLPPIAITDEQLIEGLQVLEDAIARAQEKR